MARDLADIDLRRIWDMGEPERVPVEVKRRGDKACRKRVKAEVQACLRGARTLLSAFVSSEDAAATAALFRRCGQCGGCVGV